MLANQTHNRKNTIWLVLSLILFLLLLGSGGLAALWGIG
jgi:hypothetical protein